MVNVGGPSKGCTTCITRKVRCDLQRPACVRCEKSKRVCGGYRNAGDLVFRHSTHMIRVDRSTAQQKQSRAASGTSASQVEVQKSHHPPSSPSLVKLPRLDEDNGVVVFLTNNFTCCAASEARNNMFWVPPNFYEVLKDRSARLSVECAGFMALARLNKSPHLLRQAQERYSQAILSLIDKWQRLPGHRGDTDLTAVLFLSFYELSASYDKSYRQSWLTHLNGIGTLLQDGQQPCAGTELAAQIYLKSRGQVLLNALQTRTRLSGPFAESIKRCISLVPPAFKPSLDVDMLLVRLADLQFQANRDCEDTDDLMSGLSDLDEQFDAWTKRVPPAWTFSKQSNPCHTELWWNKRYDIYSSNIMIHVWNKVRAARILIHDLLCDIGIRPAVDGTKGQRTRFELPFNHLQDLVIDICASIPLYYRPESRTAKFGEHGEPPLLGMAYWFIWILQAIATMKLAPSALTMWILQCIKRIYDTTGIVQAKLVAINLSRICNSTINHPNS